MKSFQIARLISMNTVTAQVTVLMDVDGQKVSSTRHLRRTPEGWMGKNPHPKAAQMNDKFEQRLAEAEAGVTLVEKKLEFARKVVKDGLDGLTASHFTGILTAADFLTLLVIGQAEVRKAVEKVAIPRLEDLLADRKLDADECRIVLAAVQAEYPRIVAFTGVK